MVTASRTSLKDVLLITQQMECLAPHGAGSITN
jgi:hypothetical protein